MWISGWRKTCNAPSLWFPCGLTSLLSYASPDKYMYHCYQSKFQTVQRLRHLNLQVLPLFKLLFLSKGLGGMDDDVWLRRSNELRRAMVLFSFMWAKAGLLHLSCLSFSSLLALARSYTNITLHAMRNSAISCYNPTWNDSTFCALQVGSKLKVCEQNPSVWPFKWKLLSSTLMRFHAVYYAVQGGSNF